MDRVLKCIYGLIELNSIEKIVLIVIGMDDCCPCVISANELADKAGFCTRTAVKILTKLSDDGYLIKKNRFNNDGGQLSNSYQLSAKCFNLGAKNG